VSWAALSKWVLDGKLKMGEKLDSRRTSDLTHIVWQFSFERFTPSSMNKAK
jgi:hypothetical protein